MYLNNIFLTNFRNYKSFSTTFSPRINIIQGDNATGKTNLLDSIHILLNSHSFIKKKFLNHKNKSSILKGTVTKNITYNITISLDNEKKALINSKSRKLKDFKILFPTVVYSIKDFIDFSTKQYVLSLLDKFSFVENPNIINYIMTLLKQIKLKKYLLLKQDTNGIKILNQNILKNMQIIQQHRLLSLRKLDSLLKNTNLIPKKITFNYKPFILNEKIINLEISKQQNIFTIYKDSLEIILDENDIFGYSSVGEKKMVLFSVLLSLIQHYDQNGIIPIILIDDIESDISLINMKKIIDILNELKNQIFITTLNSIKIKEANLIRLGETI